ncbi:hypothetical protein GCM10020295_17610 [Streptomyces cinereospinus]
MAADARLLPPGLDRHTELVRRHRARVHRPLEGHVRQRPASPAPPAPAGRARGREPCRRGAARRRLRELPDRRGRSAGGLARPAAVPGGGPRTGWRIQSLDSVYEQDTLAPVVPGTTLVIDQDLLATFRKPYRFLAYHITLDQRDVRDDLYADDRPDEVDALYRRLFTWLRAPR